MTKESITTEALRGICSSRFELAHYAISLGRYYIHSGRELTLQGIVKDLKKHPNPEYVHELKELDAFEEEEQTFDDQ